MIKVNVDNKLELHIGYPVYNNMPAILKKNIKDYFVFSPKRQAWVSKGKHNSYGVQSVVKEIEKYNAELVKGVEVEKEHVETLEKVASGEISVDQAVVETAQEHIAENPAYYTKLEEVINEPIYKGLTKNEFILLDITRSLKAAYRDKYIVENRIHDKKEQLKESLYKKGFLLKNGGITPEGDKLVRSIRLEATGSEHGSLYYNKGYSKLTFWDEVKQPTGDSSEIAMIAEKHGIPLSSLKDFVDLIIYRSGLDGEKLTDLLNPMNLGWRERGEKEMALMKDLIPIFKKMAGGKEIYGISLYEETSKPISAEAQAIIKPEWDKMQEFLEEDKIEKAFELGKKAFEMGKKRIPAQDVDLLTLLQGNDEISTKLLSAWLRAWDRANFNAPVLPSETKQPDFKNLEWLKLGKEITSSLSSIISIDKGEMPGFDRNLFMSSIKGKLERLDKRGETELVDKALDLIKGLSDKNPKPFFTRLHSIWSLGSKKYADITKLSPDEQNQRLKANAEFIRSQPQKNDWEARDKELQEEANILHATKGNTFDIEVGDLITVRYGSNNIKLPVRRINKDMKEWGGEKVDRSTYYVLPPNRDDLPGAEVGYRPEEIITFEKIQKTTVGEPVSDTIYKNGWELTWEEFKSALNVFPVRKVRKTPEGATYRPLEGLYEQYNVKLVNSPWLEKIKKPSLITDALYEKGIYLGILDGLGLTLFIDVDRSYIEKFVNLKQSEFGIYRVFHEGIIEKALSEGINVPQNVLDEYPELKTSTIKDPDPIGTAATAVMDETFNTDTDYLDQEIKAGKGDISMYVKAGDMQYIVTYGDLYKIQYRGVSEKIFKTGSLSTGHILPIVEFIESDSKVDSINFSIVQLLKREGQAFRTFKGVNKIQIELHPDLVPDKEEEFDSVEDAKNKIAEDPSSKFTILDFENMVKSIIQNNKGATIEKLIDLFIEESRKYKYIPQATRDEFYEKFGQNGKISQRKAAEAFIKHVKNKYFPEPLKLSDIPAIVKAFMPPMQQKAIVGSMEHYDTLAELKERLEKMPHTYQTENIDSNDKIVYLHYFYGQSDWYIVEKDKGNGPGDQEQTQAFGYTVLNGDYESAEWGYIDIEELKKTNRVELDFYWTPKKFGDLDFNRAAIFDEIINTNYRNQYDVNKAIEKFIGLKEEYQVGYTDKDIQFIQRYSGYGGLGKYITNVEEEENIKGLLFEYYTPDILVKKCWGLAYKFGFKSGKVLEPSCGPGRFIKYAPDQSLVKAYEINNFSAKIAKISYPKADVVYNYFESEFFTGFGKRQMNKKYVGEFDLVIGNAPFGDYAGHFSAMGEKDYSKAKQIDHHFLVRSLDACKPGGLVVMIVSSRFMQGNHYEVKQKIQERGELIDAYRLPNGLFQNTEVSADVLVFRKK